MEWPDQYDFASSGPIELAIATEHNDVYMHSLP